VRVGLNDHVPMFAQINHELSNHPKLGLGKSALGGTNALAPL
jgi:hypothetical protein